MALRCSISSLFHWLCSLVFLILLSAHALVDSLSPWKAIKKLFKQYKKEYKRQNTNNWDLYFAFLLHLPVHILLSLLSLFSPSSLLRLGRLALFFLSYRFPYKDLPQYVNELGFECTPHEIRTKDGFTLTLYEIFHSASLSAGHSDRVPILFLHGLFNNAFTFVFNGPHYALALILAQRGHRVYLGNNRGSDFACHGRAAEAMGQQTENNRKNNGSPIRRRAQPASPSGWDWSLGDLVHDVSSFYSFLLADPRGPRAQQLIAVGHSQGTTQLAMALSGDGTRIRGKTLSECTRLCILLSPAIFLRSFHSRWLHALVGLYEYSPRIYYAIFGHGAFFPIFDHVKYYLFAGCPLLFARGCNFFFKFLFNWDTKHWPAHGDAEAQGGCASGAGDQNGGESSSTSLFSPCVSSKDYYFYYACPNSASSKSIGHWMQMAHTKQFRHYHNHHYQRARGMQVAPTDDSDDLSLLSSFSLSSISCPLAVVSGGRDGLIDHGRLMEQLDRSKVVYDRVIPHYYHCDALAAESAPRILYGDLLSLIECGHAKARRRHDDEGDESEEEE